jgi:Right handed beta helix region
MARRPKGWGAIAVSCAVLVAGCGGGDADGGGLARGGSTAVAGTGGAAGAGGASGSIGGSGGSVAGQGGAAADGAAPVCNGPRPSASNTGVPAGTTLVPSGSIQVTQDGQLVEKLDIAGTITVLANDVTIRYVRITSGDYYPIRYFDNDNTGLVVEDSEIVGTSGDVTSAIAFANYTARRLNIHGGADGFKADSNVLIEDCWIHDLNNGPGQHNDGVQSTGGKGVTIRHNDISGASNACVQTGDEGGATEDLTVECNWLDGGGYALNIRGTGATVPKNTRIVDNRFGRHSGYGPWTIDDPAPVVTGNVYDDTGEPIPYP